MRYIKNDLAQIDHSNLDTMLLAIITHGEEDKLYGVDKKSLCPQEIIDKYTGKNCPTLIGKPKIILYQPCRGANLDPGVEEIDGPTTLHGRLHPDIPNPTRPCIMEETLIWNMVHQGALSMPRPTQQQTPPHGAYRLK